MVFGVAAAFILIAVTRVRVMGRRLPAVLRRISAVADLLKAISEVPTAIWAPSLLARALLLQMLVFLLDATTLWTLLHGIDLPVPWAVAFASFMVASMVATVGIVPLGLATFEAACVGMLSGLGLPVGAALTGTLLLRGFTLWLPMLPGLRLMRRELRSAMPAG